MTLTTKQEKGGPVEYLCLVEVRRTWSGLGLGLGLGIALNPAPNTSPNPNQVWHTAGGNEIRQAEGPRPRTIPGPEAWYWLDRWCSREGVDLSTWDCYS